MKCKYFHTLRGFDYVSDDLARLGGYHTTVSLSFKLAEMAYYCFTVSITQGLIRP